MRFSYFIESLFDFPGRCKCSFSSLNQRFVPVKLDALSDSCYQSGVMSRQIVCRTSTVQTFVGSDEPNKGGDFNILL